MEYKGQQCQDEKINKSFRELHKRLVDIVIEWCKAYNITIDEFRLYADELEDSIKIGSWQSCTDSCLRFDKYSQEYKDIISMNKIISNEEFNKIVNDKIPYLISM